MRTKALLDRLLAAPISRWAPMFEGMAFWIPDLAARLSDSDKRALLLELIARTEREPAILGATAHLFAVGR